MGGDNAPDAIIDGALDALELLGSEDQLVLEQAEEGLAHRRAAHRVHGEALAIPVAGAAHLLLLTHDPRLVLVFPSPDPLDQLLAA